VCPGPVAGPSRLVYTGCLFMHVITLEEPMKRMLLVVLAIALIAGPAVADVYVRIDSHTGEYYQNGMVRPAEDETSELWIGEKRLAFLTNALKLVIDLEKNRFIMVTLSDQGYVEGELPLTFGTFLSEQEAGQMAMYAYKGSVKKLDQTKKIGEWNCQGYEILNWIDYQGGKVNERDMVAWVTAEVPCDLKTLNEMTRHLLTLSNFSEDLVTQMLTIEGLRIVAESTRFSEGMAITTTERVVALEEKEAPAGIYEAPQDGAKKETLTLADLRG